MKKISSSGIFCEFYKNNYIYVDKTECIYNLIDNNKKIFFSRPRRFGKSLTLDAIGTLFEKGVEPYFKDTWIYDKWTEPVTPVLRLDFLSFKVDSVEAFKAKFVKKLSEFSKKYFEISFTDYDDPADALESLLCTIGDKDREIVILIDEYDRQLVANINNEELCEEFSSLIRQIYAVLKGAPAIRFMAVTGVTRLKDVSIFSAGNDIKDISNSSQFSQLIGFTRDEIRHFYIDYLKLAASIENKCSIDTVTDAQVELILDKMAQEYDGYCFDEDYEKKVFSTWSVNNFLQAVSGNNKVKYGDYWYENGGLPGILVNYLKSHQLNNIDYLCENTSIDVDYELFMNPQSLIDIDQNVLMCQTGYLTLKGEIVSGDDIKLGVPNMEVRRAILKRLAKLFFNRMPKLTDEEKEVLESGDLDSITKLFNAILNSIAYDHYCIDCESAVRNSLFLYLKGARYEVSAESQSSKGRCDLIIETKNRRIAVELKFAADEKSALSKLEEAKSQLIEKDYGNIVPLKNVMRIAAVFNGQSDVRAFKCALAD